MLYHYWSATESISIYFNSLEKSAADIVLNLTFSVPQNKESHIGMT